MSDIGTSHSLVTLPELYTFMVIIPRQALLVSGDLEGHSYICDRIVSKNSMLWKLKDNRGLRVLNYFELDRRKVSARNTWFHSGYLHGRQRTTRRGSLII